MTDHATPNLPSRDFEASLRFYGALGFTESWRDDGWMILTRGAIKLEFFPHPELDPLSSWFSCCIRLDDLDAFYALCKANGLPETSRGTPRIVPSRKEDSGITIACLVDPDGTLLRLIQN